MQPWEQRIVAAYTVASALRLRSCVCPAVSSIIITFLRHLNFFFLIFFPCRYKVLHKLRLCADLRPWTRCTAMRPGVADD